MTFRNLRGGERIKVRIYAGLGPKGPQFTQKTLRVQRLLCFPTHVVADRGRGQPVVVDDGNFVEVVSR